MNSIFAVLLFLRLAGIPCTVQFMSVSGYDNSTGAPPYQGLTASGAITQKGVCACSPDLPFGTMLFVDGVGWLQCLDRGGLVIRGFVDVWVESEDEAWEFGRSTRSVIIVRPGGSYRGEERR